MDPRFRALGVTAARVVAPWDAALAPSAELDDWLRTARAQRPRRARVVRAPPRRGLPDRPVPAADDGRTGRGLRGLPRALAVGERRSARGTSPTTRASRRRPTPPPRPGCTRRSPASVRAAGSSPPSRWTRRTCSPWLRRFAAALSASPRALGPAQLRRRHARPRAHGHGADARHRRRTAVADGERRDRAPHGRRRPPALALRRAARAGERGARPRARGPRAATGSTACSSISGARGLRVVGLRAAASRRHAAAELRRRRGTPARGAAGRRRETLPRGARPPRRCTCSGAHGWTGGASCAPACAARPPPPARARCGWRCGRSRPARAPRGGRRLLGADRRVLRAGATAALSVRLPALRRRLIRPGRTTALLADVSTPEWRERFVVRCRR